MKMVLVFDTDDMPGMKSSLKIMKQLASDNGLDHIMANLYDPKFGKIEFIKMLRDFVAFITMQPASDDISLKDCKEFADYVFDNKSKNIYYIAKWKRSP